MTRASVGVVLVLAALGGACSRKAVPASSDADFEARWQALAGGQGAITVGGDVTEALSANVRRATATREAPPPPPRAGLPEAPPGDDVQKVIRSNLAAVKTCYLTAARQGSGRSGKAIVTFGIASDGKPTNVQVDAPSFQGTGLPTCLRAQVSFWAFPRSKKGADTVSYPFVFVGA